MRTRIPVHLTRPIDPRRSPPSLYAILSLRHFRLARSWFIPWCRGARGKSTASMTRGGGDFVFAQIGAARPARAADFPI